MIDSDLDFQEKITGKRHNKVKGVPLPRRLLGYTISARHCTLRCLIKVLLHITSDFKTLRNRLLVAYLCSLKNFMPCSLLIFFYFPDVVK